MTDAPNNAEQSPRTTLDNPATSSDTADNPLRERYAAALYAHEWPHGGPWSEALAMDRESFLGLADAVLAVRDGEMERAHYNGPTVAAFGDGDVT